MRVALVNNSIVVGTANIPDEDYPKFVSLYEQVVDLSGYAYVPLNGYTLRTDGVFLDLNGAPCAASVKITKLAFESRLTLAEEAGIIGFAFLNYNSSTPSIQQAALSLLALLRRQANATFVDLKRADTISGVGYLQSLGLLTAGRVDEILNTPPTPSEEYYG